MPSKFCPDDWELTEKLRHYARSKGLSESQIDDQEEGFRLCQFPRSILCWDRAWQRWIRNGIEWGKIVVTKPREYRKPPVVTESEEEKQRAFEEHIKRFTNGAKG